MTWGEDHFTLANHIPTIFAGGTVRHGTSGARIDRYSVLRTLEDMYGLPHFGETRLVRPIRDAWKTAAERKRGRENTT